MTSLAQTFNSDASRNLQRPSPTIFFPKFQTLTTTQQNVSLQGRAGRRSLLHIPKLHRSTRNNPLLKRPPLRQSKPPLPLRARLAHLPTTCASANTRSATLSPLHWNLHILARGPVREICSCRIDCCGCGGNSFWGHG